MRGTLAKPWGGQRVLSGHKRSQFGRGIGAKGWGILWIRLLFVLILSSKTLIKYARSLLKNRCSHSPSPKSMGPDFRIERGYWRVEFMNFPILAVHTPEFTASYSFGGSGDLLFFHSIILNLIRWRLMRNQTGNQSKRFREYSANWTLKKWTQ